MKPIEMPGLVALIRPYKPADKAALLRCLNKLHADLVSKDPLNRKRKIRPIGPAYLTGILKRLRQSGGRILIATQAGQIVGTVMGLLGKDGGGGYPRHFGHVTDLFVERGLRSKGLGNRLMDGIEAYFRSRGCQAVFVDVLNFNPGARRLYLKRRYRERILTLIRLLN